MLRTTFLALGLLLFSACSFAQTTPTESQTLQALLAEVHQLRQDLQTAATAARRAQILIYRLYAQEGAVARASQRFDEAKSAVEQFQAQRKWQALQIKDYEERRDRAENATERKQLEDAISSLKTQMETWSPEEQEAHAKEIELEQELRSEQAKLDQLQDELDRLDRTVMNAASVLALRRNRRRERRSLTWQKQTPTEAWCVSLRFARYPPGIRAQT